MVTPGTLQILASTPRFSVDEKKKNVKNTDNHRHLDIIMFGSSNFYNKKCHTKEDLRKVLNESVRFSVSASQDTQSKFKHTAMCLSFDGKPRFTINFRIKDGTNMVLCLIGKPTTEITIEDVTDEDCYNRLDVLTEFSVNDESGKDYAWEIIEGILSHDPGTYNLLTNNCRDHVKGVVREMFGLRPLFEANMNKIHYEDAAPFLGGILIVFITLLLIICVHWYRKIYVHNQHSQTYAPHVMIPF